MRAHTVEFAGLTARIHSPFGGEGDGLPRPLRPFLRAAAGAPAIEIELEHVPALALPAKWADHPQFSRRREDDVLVVERADAVGRIDLAAAPLRARFQVPDDRYAIEACIRVALSVALPRRDALLLHASAVQWGGAARVFTGVSGAGKSTIAGLLADHPACARMADEMVILQRAAAGWTLHVPPFYGIDDLPLGDHAPVASIELIRQAPAHQRTPLAPAAALRELLRHVVVYAAEPATTELVLALAERLVREVPCHRLEFARDPAVAGVLGIA